MPFKRQNTKPMHHEQNVTHIMESIMNDSQEIYDFQSGGY